MKIVFITEHGCGRAIKQASALYDKGYEVALVASKLMKGGGAFMTKHKYDNAKELFDIVSLLGDKMIYHIHNEPSWMVSLVREALPNAKIIYDVHDSNYWRVEGEYNWYEEDSAIQNCDAMIFPSQSCEDRYQTLGKPTKVVWSANLEAWKYYGPWDYYGGIISQGGHTAPYENKPAETWRDYTDIYTEIIGKGKQLFAYSADFNRKTPKRDDYYIGLGATLGCFTHMELIQCMGRHDWSLCGNPNGSKVWDYALPNKFFDAMSGCAPVVNFGCTEVGKLIDEYDVGINVESVDELVERWDEHKEKRASVYRNRNEFNMEHQIDKVIDLYNEIY
ncbi:MAG: hypothetical protein HOG49_34765 [Candidatus Scalindua sp.]|nr:hypothetical protein [Candidatus Scalindua sp.]